MKLLLTEDPGIRGAGVALFDTERKELVAAGYAKSQCLKGNLALECRGVGLAIRNWVEFSGYGEADLVLLGAEWPRMLAPGQQTGDQNDLPALAGVSSAFAALYPNTPVRSFYPRDWKGTVDPDVMTNRIYGRLSAAELNRVEWTSKLRDPKRGIMHNVFDAIGIGLHILDRLAPKRVYAELP